MAYTDSRGQVAWQTTVASTPRGGHAVARGSSPSHGWFFTVGGAVVLSYAMLLGAVDGSHRFTAICAVVNLALIGAILWAALKRHPVYGTLAVAYLVPIGVQASLSTLYFCVFDPEFFVSVNHDTVPVLLDNWRFQLATITYVAPLGMAWLLLSPRLRVSPAATFTAWLQAADRVCMPAFGAFTVIVLLLLTLRLVDIDEENIVGYFSYGLFRYCLGLPILCGAAWKTRTWFEACTIGCVLLLNAGFNILTNNRSFGFFPLVFFGFGLLFFSEIGSRRKLQSMVAIGVLFLAVMILGNVGRLMRLEIWRGGFENLANRVEKLTERSDAFTHTLSQPATIVWGRLFTLGGFQTTTLVPETVPYKPFSLPQYALEVTTQGFLPRGLATRLVVPVYEEKSTLIAFGYRLVHKKHNVERYCVGAAWELGGYLAECFIGALTGLLLALFARTLVVVAAKVPQLAAVMLAIGIDRAVGATTEGVPSMLHDLAYTVPVGVCIYAIVRFMSHVPPFRSSAPTGNCGGRATSTVGVIASPLRLGS